MSRRIKILALVAAVALAIAVPAGYSVFDLNAGNDLIIADNAIALPVTNDGTVSVTSAENEWSSNAKETGAKFASTGIAGDVENIGGNVIACKNGDVLVLALEKPADIALAPKTRRVLIC